MAGEDTDTMLQQLLQETQASPQAAPAYSRENRGWVSLLGEALGGGTDVGSTEEREQGGLRALTSAGINMLMNSGYRHTPLTFGQILGSGLSGAQQSLSESEQRAGSRQKMAAEQRSEKLERIKSAIPILKLRQEIQDKQRILNTPLPWEVTPTPGAAATPGRGARPRRHGDPAAIAGRAAADARVGLGPAARRRRCARCGDSRPAVSRAGGGPRCRGLHARPEADRWIQSPLHRGHQHAQQPRARDGDRCKLDAQPAGRGGGRHSARVGAQARRQARLGLGRRLVRQVS